MNSLALQKGLIERMPKVKGTIRATAVEALSPGRTPHRMPISTPAKMAAITGRCAMVENPSIRLSSKI